MPSKNIFKYFMCWADWSMKGKSEVTPPTPNSSQFNFSPSEKSESWGKALETSDTRHKDTLKGAWSEEVADVHSWINRCLKGVPAQGSSSARVGHRNTNMARWVQLGRDGGVLRRPWWREPWACTVCCSSEQRLIFNSYLKDDASAAAQTLPTAPLHSLKWKPALWVQYLSISTRNCCIWPFHSNAVSEMKAQCEHLHGSHQQIPDFSRIFLINEIYSSPESADCE